jgi:hypothetical protein
MSRPPIEWLKARLERDQRSSTGWIWKLDQPRDGFASEGDWRAFCATNAGKRAGSHRKGRPPHIGITWNGKTVYIEVRTLDFAFTNGRWPTLGEMRKLRPWEPSAIPLGHGDVERLTASNGHVGEGELAQFLDAECQASGYTPDELTVLSKERDPFRLDTPARRRDAEWFADQFERYFGGGDESHLRSVHYVLGTTDPPIIRPDGFAYRNVYEDWRWLLNKPAKAALARPRAVVEHH